MDFISFLITSHDVSIQKVESWNLQKETGPPVCQKVPDLGEYSIPFIYILHL